ncbi:MAG: hypothetical protein LH465_09960 [Sphingomonas bacterium]|nr:hypothetical protein [Sphingomonas bacterium]
MIYKRFAARLKAQDWLAIVIEIGIVVIGVFIGTQVSNWNAARLEKVETRRMLVQLQPNLKVMTDYFGAARIYYGTTRRYATTALAGWRGDPSVSDGDFVKAAYQASQILTFGTNSSAWATVLGADQLRRIDDPAMRNDLSFLMSADYSQLDLAGVNTPYRQNVRRIIPLDLQDAIRATCGDRSTPDAPTFLFLPPNCLLAIDPVQARQAAAALRAQPALADDLQWHMAAQSALMANMVPFEVSTTNIRKRISGMRE